MKPLLLDFRISNCGVNPIELFRVFRRHIVRGANSVNWKWRNRRFWLKSYEGVEQSTWNFTHLLINVLWCHFICPIVTLMSISLNIHERWQTVKKWKVLHYWSKISQQVFLRLGIILSRLKGQPVQFSGDLSILTTF